MPDIGKDAPMLCLECCFRCGPTWMALMGRVPLLKDIVSSTFISSSIPSRRITRFRTTTTTTKVQTFTTTASALCSPRPNSLLVCHLKCHATRPVMAVTIAKDHQPQANGGSGGSGELKSRPRRMPSARRRSCDVVPSSGIHADAGFHPVERIPTYLQPEIPLRQRLHHFTFAWYTVT